MREIEAWDKIRVRNELCLITQVLGNAVSVDVGEATAEIVMVEDLSYNESSDEWFIKGG